MPYLVTFLRFFTVFTMEDKGKKVFTYCLSFLEEIGMSTQLNLNEVVEKKKALKRHLMERREKTSPSETYRSN